MQIRQISTSVAFDANARRWNMFADSSWGTVKLVIDHDYVSPNDEYRVELLNHGDSVELMRPAEYAAYVETALAHGDEPSDNVHEMRFYGSIELVVDAMIERWRMLNTITSFAVTF